MRWLFAAVLLGATLCLSGCGGSGHGGSTGGGTGGGGTPDPGVIGPSRKGLYFGYFGVDDAQVDETLDHVNMLFEWGPIEDAVKRMRKMNLPTILVVTPQCFNSTTSPWTYLGSTAVRANLQAFFDRLRTEGLLSLVCGIYPIDEPERDANVAANVLSLCVVDIRAVMADYPELAGAKLVVTYGSGEDYRALHDFDWVGFDDYGAGSGIFIPGGKYDRLRAQLLPNQFLTLFPGGADPWHTDPTPFYLKAQQDSQVIAMIPFIWLDHWAGTQNLGIHSNGAAPIYTAVGKAIKSA